MSSGKDGKDLLQACTLLVDMYKHKRVNKQHSYPLGLDCGMHTSDGAPVDYVLISSKSKQERRKTAYATSCVIVCAEIRR